MTTSNTKSNHGLVTVPSDHAWNLSIYSALPRERLEQINDYAAGATVAEDGRHYVALMMTDGDNVQWMVNDFTGPKMVRQRRARLDTDGVDDPADTARRRRRRPQSGCINSRRKTTCSSTRSRERATFFPSEMPERGV
jgi:hypothetical protein